MRGQISAGDIYSNCEIMADNEYHYFLKDGDVKATYYDIVMPKENCSTKKYSFGYQLMVLLLLMMEFQVFSFTRSN